MRHRVLAALVAATVLLALVVGCSSKTDGATPPASTPSAPYVGLNIPQASAPTRVVHSHRTQTVCGRKCVRKRGQRAWAKHHPRKWCRHDLKRCAKFAPGLYAEWKHRHPILWCRGHLRECKFHNPHWYRHAHHHHHRVRVVRHRRNHVRPRHPRHVGRRPAPNPGGCTQFRIAPCLNYASAVHRLGPAGRAWMYRVSRCESGWRWNAINLTDSNARAGHPSVGLFQFIPSTFRATPYGGHWIYSTFWQSMAAAWMYSHGGSGAWACK